MAAQHVAGRNVFAFTVLQAVVAHQCIDQQQLGGNDVRSNHDASGVCSSDQRCIVLVQAAVQERQRFRMRLIYRRFKVCSKVSIDPQASLRFLNGGFNWHEASNVRIG